MTRRVNALELLCYRIMLREQGFMGGGENQQMGVGQDWMCFDVEKEYGEEEDEVILPHRPKKACKKDCYKGRWKASGEGTDLQIHGFRM